MKLAQHVLLRRETPALECPAVAFIDVLLKILVAAVLVERKPVRERDAGTQDT